MVFKPGGVSDSDFFVIAETEWIRLEVVSHTDTKSTFFLFLSSIWSLVQIEKVFAGFPL